IVHLLGGATGRNGRVIRMGPIQVGKIETDFQVLPANGSSEFGDQVAPCRCLADHGKVRHGGVVESNTVMVLGSEYSIASARTGEQFCPAIRIELIGSEAGKLLHIVLVGDLPIIKAPGLGDTVYRIDTPVDKDA